VWSELVSQRYGVTPNPSNVGTGNIFAQGGMRVSQPSPPSLVGPGGTQRPVSTQITEYLTRTGGGADPNALYGVWVGANDLFVLAGTPGLTAADQAAFISSTATAEIQQIARLRAAGARYIMVFNIPDLGSTPQSLAGGAAAIAAGTAASVGYNTALFAGLQGAGLNVIPVDTFSLLADVRANASAFGFTNITSVACLPVGSSSLTCSPANFAAQGAATSYLFADGVHPTTGAHRIVADFAISLIEGPQQYSLLAEAPLRSRESHIRTLDTGLLTGAKGSVGKWMAFAAADGSKFDLDATGINPQLKSDQ
jgi:outer membrane lipase/esterase